MKHGSLKYKLIDTIMKDDYFKNVSPLLRQCVEYNCFEYVRLVLKYGEKYDPNIHGEIPFPAMNEDRKNIKMFVFTRDFITTAVLHPLTQLIQRPHVSMEWLDLLSQCAKASNMPLAAGVGGYLQVYLNKSNFIQQDSEVYQFVQKLINNINSF